MPFQPLDHQSCALSIHSTLSAGPPSFCSLSEEEGTAPEALGLLSQLLQPSFLNGDKPAESVWIALDKLVSPSLAHKPHQPNPFLNLHVQQSNEDNTTTEVLDDGSICVSFPVNFDPSSSPKAVIEQIQVVPYTVELVEAEVDEDGKVNPKGLANQGGKRTSEDGRKWWDFDWMCRHDEEEADSKGRKVLVAKKIFDPPKDKLSVRATWWGYEIYLPESVFVKLGNDVEPYLTSLTYFSTALALLTSQAPPFIVALPAFPLLLSLLPILSAISSSLTWYWKTMKKMDMGEGIVLSATWVLPIALVPRSWPKVKQVEEAVVKSGEEKGEMIVEKGDEGVKEAIEVSKPEREKKPNKLKRVLSLSRKSVPVKIVL
ncbi:hypothetical protein JCM5353_006995 [Sporobolomyces roseus]